MSYFPITTLCKPHRKNGVAPPPVPWMDVGWSSRLDLTIDKNYVPGSVTNVPLRFDFSRIPTDHPFWGKVASDGSDLAFSDHDQTTRVPMELVSFDTSTKSGEAYYMLPTLCTAEDCVPRLYYDNSEAIAPANNDQYGREGVWNSDFGAVWHAQTLEDSTSNNRDLTANNGATLEDVAGVIGTKRLKFIDGHSEFAFTSLTVDEFYVSCYLYNNGPTDGITLLGGPSQDDIFWQRLTDTAERLRLSNKYTSYYSDLDANWRWLVIQRNSSSLVEMWRDGAAVPGGSVPANNVVEAQLEWANLGNANYNLNWDLSGYLDEVRLMTVDQSTPWREIEKNNIMDLDNFMPTIGDDYTLP